MSTSRTAICIALSAVMLAGPESASLLATALTDGATLCRPGIRCALAFAPPGEAQDDARALYDQGRSAYDTGDYEEAVRLWKQAYALVPTDEESRAVRHEMVYNLAEAHIRVYRVKGSVESLRTAKVLLEDYIRRHEVLYGDSSEAVAERKAAQERLGDVDRMLKSTKSSSGGSATPQPSGGTSGGSETRTSPEGPAGEVRTKEEVLADPASAPKWKKATGLVIAGSVLLGVGGVMGLGGLGLAPTRLLEGDGNTDAIGTSGALVGGGAVLILAGAIMLGVGVTRRKALKKQRPSSTTGLWQRNLVASPWLDHRGGGGFAVQARF